MQQTLHALRERLPSTHVVLLGLLPRGNGGPRGIYHWPSLFTQPFESLNAQFREFTTTDGHLHFLDCSERFFSEDGKSLRADLLPDALHPSAAGYELLAQCLDPLVTKLMQRTAAAAAAEGEHGGGKAEGGGQA